MSDTDQDTTRLLERLAETFPARPAPLPSLLEAARAGRRRRTRRTVAATAAACALVVGGGTLAAQAVLGRTGDPTRTAASPAAPCSPDTSRTSDGAPVPRGPGYPTNANGETYGGASDGGSSPDLLAVVGDCGRTGYVRRDDLDEPEPWDPAAGEAGPRPVDVYESDGVTRIDTFTTASGVSGSADGVGDPATPSGPDAADLQGGAWTAIIAGVTGPEGSEQYDTFRDLDLAVTFLGDEDGDRVRVWDGCRAWEAGFALTDGEFSLTGDWQPATPTGEGCERVAPLPAVVANIRHVTRDRGRVHLHLGSWQIVVVLERPDA